MDAFPRPGNSLLRSLSTADFEHLTPHLERFELTFGSTLYEMEDPVDWVYFPETGLVSIISILVSGAAIETSILGREGGVGFIEALGGERMHSRFIVQVPGHALRLPARRYVDAFNSSPSMRNAVQRQVELLLAEARQAIACHTLHPVEGRLSRWLLECQDLSGGLDVLPLTQELLSVMLGVQRTTVTRVAMAHQHAGLIRYTRGRIAILDREGLERTACECRATVQALRGVLAPLEAPPVAA